MCAGIVFALAVAGLGSILTGCAYHGESEASIDNPLVQKASWFSFLDGHDIRQACVASGPKAPDSYRLVYNGQYLEQVRTYEITGVPSGGAALLARAKGPTNLSNWWIRQPSDLFAPWRWTEARTSLGAAEFGQFRAALAHAGYGGGAPQGLRLPSQDFYWVASGCSQGRFHFYAWLERDGQFDNVPFQDFLLRHDGTGVPFRQPHVLNSAERQSKRGGRDRDDTGDFTLEVDGEGIGGLINAF